MTYQEKKDVVSYGAGLASNFGFSGIFNTLPIYFTPKHGREFAFSVSLRRIATGFDGLLFRAMANIPVNTRPDDTVLGVRVGIFNLVLLTIPAGTTGQFDSLPEIKIASVNENLLSLFVTRGIGIAGEAFQMEKFTVLLEVES